MNRSGACFPPAIRRADNAPAHWFAFAIDLQTHFGERAPLDYLAPALALRFRLYKGLGLELAGMVPVLGDDRHDALITLRGGWRY